MKSKSSAPETIGSWLRRELDSRDMIGADLARRIGSSNGTVSNWITGTRVPNPETIQRIADALNADVDYLLTLAGHRPEDPYFDPDSPEAQLLPYIRAVDWSKHGNELAMFKRQLEFLVEVDRGEHNRT
jgi:transcriptional regulator with XRE-family HTH domain